MSSFTVGYLVGSLATASINRLLAMALVGLSPLVFRSPAPNHYVMKHCFHLKRCNRPL